MTHEYKLSTEMKGENNNNIGLIDSDCDSVLDTYYYGCLSSDDDVIQPIPVNNDVSAAIINHQDLWCIDDSNSEHYDSDNDPEYTPQLDNFNLVDEALVNDDVPVADNNYDALNDVNSLISIYGCYLGLYLGFNFYS
ncbi:uncharacterized protein LOC107882364 [Acyrthosiphon pisum]|uniref:Uncharacterized protein n=1 Tax=Acyrthosiphon pisum TaxID=7029 RepID=A0A8R2D116_ACYPI|nr:uncharacterized protein LOC107882364 [Acyrthosiphon pisum]|eukprot:XP_016656093.1 PREDICTED: uncharacterized protein LOC107882364 [Acyrthosiphon pisum]